VIISSSEVIFSPSKRTILYFYLSMKPTFKPLGWCLDVFMNGALFTYTMIHTNTLSFLTQIHTLISTRKMQVILLSRAIHVGPNTVHRLLNDFNLVKLGFYCSSCTLHAVLTLWPLITQSCQIMVSIHCKFQFKSASNTWSLVTKCVAQSTG